MRLAARLLAVALLALAPAAAARAAGPVFDTPQALGAADGAAFDTSVARGPRGDTAVVWRGTGATVWAAVRRPGDDSWHTRALGPSGGSSPRNLSVTITRSGRAVAIWADLGASQLMAAVASPGAGFQAPIELTPLDNAFAAAAHVVTVGSDRVAVIWRDGRRGRSKLFARTIGPSGLQAVHPVGVPGVSFTAVAPTSGGALVAVENSAAGCSGRGCLKPGLYVVALDHDGKRDSPVVRVAAGGTAAGRFTVEGPHLAVGGHGHAVVSWGLFGGPDLVCMSRSLHTDPLRLVAPATAFPNCGGPGFATPGVAVSASGETVGAVVAPATQGSLASASRLSAGNRWTATQTLSPGSGWTTVPQLTAGGDGVLGVFATAIAVAGPATYSIEATWHPGGGRFGAPVQIGTFSSGDASGLSVGGDGLGDVAVAWPAVDGGIDVALSR